ncbi:TonB-dependent receptor plug domain-containing protein [Hydrogenimonas sp.]
MRRVFATLAVAMVGLALSPAPIQAEESIESLLKSYRKEADLSKQTKKENAGFVVVYTRDDMERMQIYRLSDILRELRFKTHNLNDFGMADPIHDDPYFYSSDIIKVYVNDHEITSGFSGSGLQFYGNVDMGMFDHVEVYYHAPVLDIATEPAAILIKLYTKDPERENGGSLVARLGDRGTQELALSHAKVMEEWSYYAYAEESDNNFRHYTNTLPRDLGGKSYEVSREYIQQHVYLDLHNDTQRLELEYLDQKHDPFTGQSLLITPTGGYWKQPMLRASYSADLLDDELHVDASYIYSELNFDITSDGPFWGQFIGDFNVTLAPPNHFHTDVDGNLFTVKTYYEKKVWDKHLVKMGLEYRYKDATLKNYYFDFKKAPDRDAYMHYSSVYVQDQYQVISNAMLSASIKYNYYDFERHAVDTIHDSMDTWQGRVAFSYIKDEWYFKIFASHVEFPTQLYVLVLHDYILDSQKFNAVSSEIKYKGEKNDYRVFLSHSWMEDIFLMNTLQPHVILRTDFQMNNLSFDFTHRFSPNHRLDFNINWSKFDDIEVPKTGFLAGCVRLLDTFGSLDLYNEIIYREETPYLDTGWDYSVGAIYHVTPDLKFSLKAINVLDEAQEQFFLTPGINEGYKTMPIVGKQFYVSVEWLF